MKHKVLMLAVVAAAATASQAQELPSEMARMVRELQAPVALPRLAVESRVTKGAPYSAEAVTEFEQVLSDGNRISRRTVARIFRDSEGRTRREQTNRSPDGKETVSISIVDPVAQASHTLDPEARIAYRSGAVLAGPAIVGPSGMGSGGGARGGGRGGGGGAIGQPPPPPAATATAEVRPRVAPAVVPPEMPGGGAGRGSTAPNKEELGQQVMEGVMVEGTRTTTVIPAGAVGNVKEIRVVSEQWMSVDLGVLVATKHSDPRTGETTYRLTNIVRAEQDRSLFEVPPDYTIQSGGGGRGGRGGGQAPAGIRQ
jgi:hypothetical protein